jgi:hypothetical protein
MKYLLTLALLFFSFSAYAQCGPPAYAPPCSVTNTSIVNYAHPIPSWGPNNCDPSNTATVYTIALCGNLTGAGTVVTTPDAFHSTMTRCTDSTIKTSPSDINAGKHVWQTADEPSVNLWNSDDTAVLLLINGGGQFIFLWNGTSCHLLVDSGGNGITFPTGSIWSRTANNHIYSLDNTTPGGPYLIDNLVNLTQNSGSVTPTTIFHFADTTGPNANLCLTNAANGYTGGAFPLNEWTGSLSSQDGVNFAAFFSLLPAQGGGYFSTIVTVGQGGCDLYNTKTGTVTHSGTLLGTIPDTQWGGRFGGKADRFLIHDGNMPNPTNATMAATSSGGIVYGTYSVGDYFWQKGTTNVLHCGLGAPDWKASQSHKDGDRVLPIPTSTNAGGFIFQIINGVGGTSGATEPVWDQTPGHDVSDNGLTWRNVGLGSAVNADGFFTYACDGHQWKGYIGLAVGKQYTYHSYVNPQVPLLALTPGVSSVGDQHFGNTNDNTTDTAWVWVSASNQGSNVDQINGTLWGGTTIPSALYGEGFFVAPPYRSVSNLNCAFDVGLCPTGTLGQVRRVLHCYTTGWNPSFDVEYCMTIVSQTGKYAVMPTDAFGQFGSIQNAAFPSQAKCNIGGPNWDNSDGGATVWHVGDMTFPALNNSNNGNYIYKVASCDGGVCTKASSGHPTWVQPGGGMNITGWTITSNVVTFTGVYPGPQFVAGNTPTISGLIHGSYLNGPVTVTSSTATTFKAAFGHANDSATENGTAGTAGTPNAAKDGTINWVTAPDINTAAFSAVENCRPDVLIVKLFQGGAAPPTTAPTLLPFVKLSSPKPDFVDESEFAGGSGK